MMLPTRVLMLLVALLLAPGARAQVSASAPADAIRGPGHGWVALPADTSGYTLWHLPPRLSSSHTAGATSGSLWSVAPLRAQPELMAAWGSDVWLISAAPRAEGDTAVRRVHRVTVRPSPIGDGWQYLEQGRLRTERPLSGAGRLIDAAGSAEGLCVLLQAPGDGQWRLLRLERDGWAQLELPGAVATAQAPAAVGLVALREGIGVWAQADGEAVTLWRGVDAPEEEAEVAAEMGDESATGEGATAAPEGEPEPGLFSDEVAAEAATQEAALRPMQWDRRPLAAAVETTREARLWAVGGRIVASEWLEPGGLRLRDLSGARAVRLAEMSNVNPGAAVCALDGSRRMALVWRQSEAGAAGEAEAGEGGGASKPPAAWNPLRIIEISTDDGSVMYDGEAQSPGPVSPAEFTLLAIALVAISAGALVFIAGGDVAGRRAMALPDATALAPARVRIAAGVIDGSLAWLLAAVAAERWQPLEIIVGGVALDFVPLLATLGVGWALGSLTEWLTGRSPGKWMAGCAVVSVRPADQKPGLMRAPRLWQSLVRNFVKWPLAPVAMLGLATPELRHRGDTLSQTAVVIPVRKDEG